MSTITLCQVSNFTLYSTGFGSCVYMSQRKISNMRRVIDVHSTLYLWNNTGCISICLQTWSILLAVLKNGWWLYIFPFFIILLLKLIGYLLIDSLISCTSCPYYVWFKVLRMHRGDMNDTSHYFSMPEEEADCQLRCQSEYWNMRTTAHFVW